MQIQKVKHGFQYAPNWTSTVARTHRLQPLCTNNPFHGKATVVHHLKYRRSIMRRILGLFLLHKPCKSVSGREIPGYDVVTVCEFCHANAYGYGLHERSLHHKSVWVKAKSEKGKLSGKGKKGSYDGLGNRQVWWKCWELRVKFWVLVLFNTVKRILN
jgi:hypothetical protein